MIQFAWKPAPELAGFKAVVGDVTLVVTPDRFARGFTPKPARDTKWHAQCTHWDAKTSTASRYGRCEYGNLQATAKDAMRLAEDIFNKA